MAARNGIPDRSDAELRQIALNYAVTYAHVNSHAESVLTPEEVVTNADVYAKYLIDGTVPSVNPAF